MDHAHTVGHFVNAFIREALIPRNNWVLQNVITPIRYKKSLPSVKWELFPTRDTRHEEQFVTVKRALFRLIICQGIRKHLAPNLSLLKKREVFLSSSLFALMGISVRSRTWERCIPVTWSMRLISSARRKKPSHELLMNLSSKNQSAI